MPEDRSLDDFAEANDVDGTSAETGSDGAEGDAADSDGTDADAADGPTDTAAVDPAVATSTWHADGAACDRCGERVERRWRDEADFVCADCASW
ncbi:hypothetical protein C465_08246 [Halorubrum distributum JCM 9100]|uniref:DUF7573 domain-containing protein n=4 Tax=Halorubrum distributum TaxID=29283 RepID=M0EP47_9EURY|nr:MULTISPECIES: hypothetical protein [Halorubrum distributum group]ELZ32304.1 hypothetical protein C473_09827 [Halorubrum terrestre JCM 10247]ELZ49546.1 hypothetical protein C465_08246 [Halorubrum distributum JCM 9100]ELZ57451.1 hypothetical protein C466_01474 [Halorubrum distributum JCM 10118]EMA69797.1 hypothetical protein C462_11985 [Halorubrum arcis JCM 13916]